jgi:hypothetical protein
MHKSLNKFAIIAAAGSLALTPAMAAAHDEPPAKPAPEAAPPAGDAKAKDPRLASLPADKQAAVLSWPPETQAYFWTLSAERQTLFWQLSDTDKVRLSQLPDEQKQEAWARIESRSAPSQA